MTELELVDKLDDAIKNFERATKKTEEAQIAMQDASLKLRDLLGSNEKDIAKIKSQAHEKIGAILLNERRKS